MKPQPDVAFAAFVRIDWSDTKHDICLEAGDSEEWEFAVDDRRRFGNPEELLARQVEQILRRHGDARPASLHDLRRRIVQTSFPRMSHSSRRYRRKDLHWHLDDQMLPSWQFQLCRA